MPVVPILAYVGTAMGASAATAAAVGAATVATTASVAATGYSMVKQNQAAKASEALAKGTAGYNSRVDLANASQIEMDATQNEVNARRDAAVYTSRQQAAYASSGVLSSGSALAVQAETAGRLNQRILQDKLNAGREAEKMRSSAAVGIMYGDAQASAINQQNNVNMFKGGMSILSTVAGAYQSGTFASMGSGGSSYTAAANKGFLF